MLSRVAAHLYWMSRYLERAENMARILDVTQSLAMLDRSADSGGAMTPIVITEAQAEFAATNLPATYENVVAFLAWDRQHPSSIRNCIESTRENARAVRGSITSEMWENINDTWIAFQEKSRSINPLMTGNEFFEWVKERSHLFRGITFATARRDQPYHFVRLGTFIERADNTARILDVKYFILLPKATDVGSDIDLHQWGQILRSVSAHRAYRWFYRNSGYKAWLVAEFLILREEMPRSLLFSYSWICTALAGLAQLHGKRYDIHAQAEETRDGLRKGRMEDIFQSGLREYLQHFIQSNNQLSRDIATTYNFP